jgi:hypothetical protein
LSSFKPPLPPAAFGPRPELYPHRLDAVSGQAWFVRLSRAQYEAASFLDDRVLTPGQQGEWATLDDIAAAAAGLKENCHFIFHIGHVGSTLISRLLGATDGLFSLREPTPLPVLAHLQSELGKPESLWSLEQFEDRTALFLKLWSRTFEPHQAALIKATSWGAGLAASLLARPSQPRALFLAVEPETFLAGVMASSAAWDDVSNAAQATLKRLHERLGEAPWILYELSPGERIAMSWACEMTALGAARGAAPRNVMWLDFEGFLDMPEEGLTAALSHFGQAVDPRQVEALVRGPLMQRYSKMPEHRFDREFRRRVLAQARATHGEEIARGMAWLDSASRRFPLIAAARGELGVLKF